MGNKTSVARSSHARYEKYSWQVGTAKHTRWTTIFEILELCQLGKWKGLILNTCMFDIRKYYKFNVTQVVLKCYICRDQHNHSKHW